MKIHDRLIETFHKGPWEGEGPKPAAPTSLRPVKRLTREQIERWKESWRQGSILTDRSLSRWYEAAHHDPTAPHGDEYLQMVRSIWPGVWHTVAFHEPGEIGMLWCSIDGPRHWPTNAQKRGWASVAIMHTDDFSLIQSELGDTFPALQ